VPVALLFVGIVLFVPLTVWLCVWDGSLVDWRVLGVGRCGPWTIAAPRRKADWSAVASDDDNGDDDDGGPRVGGERRDSIVGSAACCS
jgi:hypothetical protein